MRVAVVGEGGSGKSILAGVLALDLDTVPGLAYSLGLGAVRAVGDLADAFGLRPKAPHPN